MGFKPLATFKILLSLVLLVSMLCLGNEFCFYLAQNSLCFPSTRIYIFIISGKYKAIIFLNIESTPFSVFSSLEIPVRPMLTLLLYISHLNLSLIIYYLFRCLCYLLTDFLRLVFFFCFLSLCLKE